MTVLDQKAKGVAEPLLYTREEMESALEAPRPEPSFTSPGWRRKLSWGTYLTAQSPDGDVARMAAAIQKGVKTPNILGSPMVRPSQGRDTRRYPSSRLIECTAIGWSLTGTMNSPSTNVAVMYSSDNNKSRDPKSVHQKLSPASGQPSIAALISKPPIKAEAHPHMPSPQASQYKRLSMPPPPAQSFNASTPDPMLSDADLLLNLHSPFPNDSPSAARGPQPNPMSYAHSLSISNTQQPFSSHNDFSPTFASYPMLSDNTFGDMVIDTQDVDMSLLGVDMMPWDLEYLPQDLLYFNDASLANGGIEGLNTSGSQNG
jgi:hypothetical protein